MRHRKQNYVVGFGGEGQCIYGEDVEDERYATKVSSFTQPMTRGEAEVAAKSLSVGGSKRYIFKLVTVKCLD